MSSVPTFHDQTTTGGTTTGHATDSVPHTHTNTNIGSDPDAITSASATHDSNINTTDDTSAGEYRQRLNSEYEPTTSISQPRGSLSSTVGPFQVPTTDDVGKSEVPPTSSVGQQNAPGRGGEIGEKAMGALGYGGSTVERPKEEQGVAEKIVNFLGA